MQKEQIEVRKQRGLEIAKTSRIQQNEKGQWKVPSQSGAGFYTVESNGFEAKCNCPDHELRNCKCKHLWAVEFVVTKQIDNEGNVTVTIKKKTYSQDWKSYNLAQQREKELFMKLLADITSRINNPTYEYGRPSNNISDTIYSMVFKVYSTFDSTGFGTSNFQRWYSFKHGKEISTRRWVKCHFMTGVKTNVISSVTITSEFDNDCPEFKELYNKTAENFSMEELSGDKAYLSQDNLELPNDNGTKVFIPFKSNSQASGNGMVWKKMYHYFMLNNDEFLQHYHKRSNAESTVHMIKSKFGDYVRSKTWTAQINEVLCKIICHNVCVVIMEMYELGINPNF